MKKRMGHFTHVQHVQHVQVEAKRVFSNSRKIFPTKEMLSIALIIAHVKSWPQRSKLFNQLLKSKSQPLTARADRLTY